MITQRQSVLGLLTFGAIACLAGILIQLIWSDDRHLLAITSIALLAFGGLLFAYWRGWDYARYVILVIITGVVFISMVPAASNGAWLQLVLILPPLMAFVLSDIPWVVGSGLALYVGLLVRENFDVVYSSPTNMLMYGFCLGVLVLGKLVSETHVRLAQANARQAEEIAHHAQAQAEDLARSKADLEQQNEQQRRLLDLVATLETPAVALAEGVLLAPVVGHLDSRRAQALTARLLQEVSGQRARMVVIDIASVTAVDTQVAQALLRAAQALRLLGCAVTITGISASVAATITHLGISLSEVATARTPQEALAHLTPTSGSLRGSRN